MRTSTGSPTTATSSRPATIAGASRAASDQPPLTAIYVFLGLLRGIRLAFFSARFLRSTLIFSIKVLISGAGTLRVEFIALPSSKLVGERLIKFRDKAIKQTLGFRHTPPDTGEP